MLICSTPLAGRARYFFQNILYRHLLLILKSVMVVVFGCLFVIACLTATTYPLSHSLASSSWSVHNTNSSIRVKATVPGGIYSDLSAAGVLTEDIFYRFNDENYRWVARDNWTYSISFDVDSKILEKDNVFLEFEGLDTVARVVLNSHLLGDTTNMFVLYKFNVKDVVQRSNNFLEVHFTSPIYAALEASTKTPYHVPPACVPSEYHGECHINYLRKMQASFAWDWGPAFPSVGIWKSVVLRGYDKVYARHVGVETRPDATDWKVSVTLYVDITATVSGTMTAILIVGNMDKLTEERYVTVSPEHNSSSLVLSVPRDKVQVWWPNGYGSQALYKLSVSFRSDHETTHKSVRIGFRTVQLVQTDADPADHAKGLTFYFRVNGVAIFAKGSNYIPSHILPELSAEPERVRHLLTSTRNANMNMLRVWGGGLYESDLFYDICDELGILIWQDMMFACSMYPATEEFLASVATEVAQQVSRLQHHACIAVWAGNNENEAALAGNWYGTQDNFTLFKEDYVELYVNTIRPIIQKLDKTRSYVTSSPSNAAESDREGYVARNPYDNKYGDVHYYQYTMNLWNPEIYPKTRFASEYGVMSLPSIESLANVSLPEDLSLTSDFMNRRQHHAGGYIEITLEIKFNLHLPTGADLETYIYLSQINQAMSIKTQTEAYRRGRGTLDSAGQGLTMGALYWQLNDVWQGPSWSSIELNGKWKMLHYFAVDFFSPVLVSPSVDVRKELRVHVISDLKPHLSLNLVLQLSIYSWQSFTPVFRQHYPFTLPGAGVFEVGSWNMDNFLHTIDGCKPKEHPEKNCFFHFSLFNNNKSSSVGPDNFQFPTPLHSVNGPSDANIKVEDVKLLKGHHELIITLRSDAIALFVWLDVDGVAGHFSHNGFLMITDMTQLTFISDGPVDVDKFKNSMKINSLKFR